MFNCRKIVFVYVCAFIFAPSISDAERAPQNPGQLREQSDLVITGKVLSNEIKTEVSRVEGSGNYDNAIYTTIEVQEIVKGGYGINIGDSVVVRTHLARSRRGMMNLASTNFHRPIPDVGEIVTSHSYSNGNNNQVIYPNGIQSGDETEVAESQEIIALRDRGIGFTYLLPVEIWIAVIFLGGIATAVLLLVQRRKAKVA